MSTLAPFHQFAAPVRARLEQMLAESETFTTEIGRDELFAAYLAAYPEGSNPIFRTRAEHDCQCCKSFIGAFGGAVSLKDGVKKSIWNIPNLPYPYDEVAKVMDKLVMDAEVKTILRLSEPQYGVNSSTFGDPTSLYTMDHLWMKVPARIFAKGNVAAQQGVFNAALHVFKRALREITPDSINTVRELIDANSLYRGEEHKGAVTAFQSLRKQWAKMNKSEQSAFEMLNCARPGASIKNTVIGSLLMDLSEGKDVENAVTSFETKVAPMNYRRPTSLITQSMITSASEKLKALGLEESVYRRLADISDVTVNNVLWVDRSTKSKMKNGGLDSLVAPTAGKSAKPTTATKGKDISIEDFMSKVLPVAQSVSLLLENRHTSSLMTLTTEKNAGAGNLFSWGNPFAWSYKGNVADSITERVKAAGGNVDAKLRFSLAWTNFDDLDIYVCTPDKQWINYMNKRGHLDVDMNAGRGQTRTPVENVSFVHPIDGTYTIEVNQFARRETVDAGFTIEVVTEDTKTHYHYPSSVGTGSRINVGQFVVKGGVIVESKINASMKHGASTALSIDTWGVKTGELVKVNTIMFSPNHWDGEEVGNKHHFFILDNCRTDEPVRGIYNEFLKPALNEHRKVFEVLGSKNMCEASDKQLSGVGFSSTKRDNVTVSVVEGTTTKLYNIKF